MNWPMQQLTCLGTVQTSSTPSSAHPANWPVFSLGNVCSVRRGTTITQTQAKPGEIPVVAGGLAATYFHDTPNRKGNVITVSASGASAGFVNYWETPIFASDCSTVESESPDVSIKYVFHFLRGKQEYIYSKLRSGAAQPHVYAKDISALKILIPPLPEQSRIAAILDQADALRAKRREALAQLDNLTQSIFIEMFGDPVTKPRGIKVVHLSEITTRITDGVHQKPNYTEEGVPFISVKDITSGVLKFDQCKFISLDDHKKFTKRCKAEYLDILYTKVGATYGRPALVNTDKEFSLYVSVCLIKPERKLVDSFFLNAALGTAAIKSQADRRIKGIGVPDLHLDQIQNFLIPLPTMEKQREFAERVALVEKLKNKHRVSIVETDKLFGSLQHLAFLGEL